ncbi:Ankyrin repeat domain-containing protein SOWAHC [Manis javanica]|nr:Ankyrin repeat domain-containing protein SOWAHC [Manis javanica]
MAQVAKFDFVIINELFESALFDLKTIIHAQRLKLPGADPNRFQLVAPPTRPHAEPGPHAQDRNQNKPGVTALREIAEGKVGLEMLKKVPG